MSGKQAGFTLIELLIVVAIIGIIAAIAIPNLLNAIDRGKQKRTMADMRSIGTACEEYSIDSNNFYPVQTAQGPISGTISGVPSLRTIAMRLSRHRIPTAWKSSGAITRQPRPFICSK